MYMIKYKIVNCIEIRLNEVAQHLLIPVNIKQIKLIKNSVYVGEEVLPNSAMPLKVDKFIENYNFIITLSTYSFSIYQLRIGGSQTASHFIDIEQPIRL